MSIHPEGSSCSDLGQVLVLKDPPGRPTGTWPWMQGGIRHVIRHVIRRVVYPFHHVLRHAVYRFSPRHPPHMSACMEGRRWQPWGAVVLAYNGNVD
jgi:hypothetical protein